jgi:hypothetical protein
MFVDWLLELMVLIHAIISNGISCFHSNLLNIEVLIYQTQVCFYLYVCWFDIEVFVNIFVIRTEEKEKKKKKKKIK